MSHHSGVSQFNPFVQPDGGARKASRHSVALLETPSEQPGASSDIDQTAGSARQAPRDGTGSPVTKEPSGVVHFPW